MKNFMRAVAASVILTTSVLSAGCSHLPFTQGVKAETYRQRLVQAEVSFQTILARAVAYKQAGKLTDEQAQDLSVIFIAAGATLDAANESERAGIRGDFEQQLLLLNNLILKATTILGDGELVGT